LSDELLPGDIVEVPQGKVLPCDLILLTGSAIVNESMLMGESIPVSKTSLHSTNEIYSDEKCTKHTLYGGTDVI
jgi:cation-transporting ATPase 13A2